jgi:hypothetical protein
VSRSVENKSPSPQTLRGLDGLNFLLADVQTGVGPFLAIYLAGYKWNEERVGIALTVGGIAGILSQTPAGALVDLVRSKRALVAAAVVALAAGALLIALFPSFWPVMGAQVLIGGTSSVFIPAICAMSLGIVGRGAFDARQNKERPRRADFSARSVAAWTLFSPSARHNERERQHERRHDDQHGGCPRPERNQADHADLFARAPRARDAAAARRATRQGPGTKW